MLSEKATGIPSSVDNISPNPAYESSTMCPQDDDKDEDVIYEYILSKQTDESTTSYVISVWLQHPG